MSQRSSVEARDKELIAELYPSLRRIAAVAGGVDVEPDDLVQEALVRTLTNRNLSELDNPLAYLRRAIVNLASNQRRSNARGQRAVARLSDSESLLPSYPADVEAILDLSPRHRAILYLVEVERVSYTEAADQLGITTAAARQLAARARKRARLNLEVAGG
jgi:RNA polymerase sigma-70 factor (ECF subfamily)